MPRGTFLVHELDFLQVISLAIKAANNKPSKINTTINEKQNIETDPSPSKDLNGGTNKSISRKMTTEHKISTKEDIELQEDINRILNNETITCQTKTDQIMDIIYKHRKNKVLEADREKLPPAQSRLLLQGGCNEPVTDSLTDDKQLIEKKGKVKAKQTNNETSKKVKVVPKKEIRKNTEKKK